MPASKVTALGRPELLDELRRHAHHTWYPSLLKMPTWALRKLIAWYGRKDK